MLYFLCSRIGKVVLLSRGNTNYRKLMKGSNTRKIDEQCRSNKIEEVNEMKYVKEPAKKYEPGFCAACGGNCDNRCADQCVVVK